MYQSFSSSSFVLGFSGSTQRNPRCLLSPFIIHPSWQAASIPNRGRDDDEDDLRKGAKRIFPSAAWRTAIMLQGIRRELENGQTFGNLVFILDNPTEPIE
jgi:hypothetical protein